MLAADFFGKKRRVEKILEIYSRNFIAFAYARKRRKIPEIKRDAFDKINGIVFSDFGRGYRYRKRLLAEAVKRVYRIAVGVGRYLSAFEIKLGRGLNRPRLVLVCGQMIYLFAVAVKFGADEIFFSQFFHKFVAVIYFDTVRNGRSGINFLCNSVLVY